MGTHDSQQAASKQDVDRILEAVVYLYTEGRRATKEVARRHGLTGPQVTAIKMLEGFGDLSLSALSNHMSARNSTVTGLVDRMESSGLVERVRSSEDRRVVLIRLTAHGHELARAIPVTSMDLFSTALRSLSTSERDALRGILRKLSDEVRKQLQETEQELQQTEPRGG